MISSLTGHTHPRTTQILGLLQRLGQSLEQQTLSEGGRADTHTTETQRANGGSYRDRQGAKRVVFNQGILKYHKLVHDLVHHIPSLHLTTLLTLPVRCMSCPRNSENAILKCS